MYTEVGTVTFLSQYILANFRCDICVSLEIYMF